MNGKVALGADVGASNDHEIPLIDPGVRSEDAGAALSSELESPRRPIQPSVAGVGTWNWDLVTGTVHWSAEMYRTLSIDPACPDLFAAWVDVLHPEDRAAASADAVRHSAAPGPFSMEFRIVRPDGEVRWILSEGVCLADAASKPIRMLGVNIDLTERKRVETALRQSQKRLEEVLDLTKVGLWEADLASGTLTASPTCKANFGLPPDAEFTYSTFNAAIPPEDRAALQAAKARALQGEPYEVEYRNLWPDGTTHWIYSRAKLERDPAGTPVRLCGVSLDTTERHRADEALRIGEQRLRATFDQAPVGIAETDENGRFLRVNDKLCELTGFTRDEMLGLTLAQVTWSDDREQDFATYRRQWAGELDSYAVEKRYVRKDGVASWVAVSSTIVRGADGKPLYAIRAVRDISQRKQAEEALAEETRSLEALNRVGTLLTAELDLDRLVQAVTDAGTELTGARMGVFLQRVRAEADQSFMPCALAGVPQPAFERMGVPGNAEVFGPTFCGEAIVRSDDITLDPRYGKNAPYRGIPAGHPPVRSYLAVPVTSRAGQVIGGLVFGHERAGVFTDRSERLVAGLAAQAAIAIDNASLLKQAQELNATLERRVEERTRERDRTWRLSQDLLLVARFDSTIEAVSPSWTTALGWSEDELRGRLFLDLVHPDDRERTVTEAGNLSQGLTTHRFENRYRRRDGSFRWISWTAVPDESRIYATGRDVTSDKEREAALAQAAEQLRQSHKMEAVGQLTGGIAHEFNNLLAGITGSLELVMKRVASGRVDGLERFAAAAMASASRAAALTQRLLAFARRQPLSPKRIAPNALIGEMRDLLRGTLGPSIDLQFVLPDATWPTLCDPNQLESALMHLAANARDAMPGGGQLKIETANVSLSEADARLHPGEFRPGDYVCLSVTDTGVGMSPEVAARAFDPFFTTKPPGQGTGLGLSMLYGFVKQSDGHVRIRSEAGRGTTVQLYLPRYRGGGPDEPGQRPAAREGFEQETVLVVDDEPTLRMLVTETLSELGYRALEVADGVSALEIIRSGARIDLLVTDVGLPGMNGRQLAEAARTARPGLKVLFITGYAHNAALGEGGELERGTELLTKPFSLDTLAVKVRTMVEAD